MESLTSSPLRMIALLVAAITVIPTAFAILHTMARLTTPTATRRERLLDQVWLVIPLAVMILMLTLVARA
ncbi:MAG: hypothetical protein KDC33_02980 [Thermoleophilia bacterium]|nr:hypothetical protein [Thermoleophilia bacterium]